MHPDPEGDPTPGHVGRSQPIVGDLSSTLSQRTDGAVTLPAGTGNIVLLPNDQLLSGAQSGVKLLRLSSTPLALAGLAVPAAAVALSRERRKTLLAIA